MPLLEVRGVSKSFGGVAANVEISFDVAAGEILGLIGPNGAGKTSLFNAISGEVTPDRGEIRLDGERISGTGPVACSRAGIARTFQVVRSFDSMTVRENVMVGAFSRVGRAREGDGGGGPRAGGGGDDRAGRSPGAFADPAGETPAGDRARLGDPAAPAAAGRDADRADPHRGAIRRAIDPRRAPSKASP